MTSPFFASQSFITVAVAFDRHTVPLVKIGAELAQRLGKQLCLLHVIEPWAKLSKSRPFGASSPLWDTMPAIESSVRDRSLERLGELKADVPKGIEVRTAVVSGRAIETLTAEAADIGTCLLLVGVGYNESRFVPSGLSTGFSLLASCPVPVMVIDTSLVVPDFAGHLRILLADDLADQSLAAVEFAAALSDGAGRSWVHHVHVNALSAENLRTALEAAAAAAYTSLPEGEVDAVVNAMRRDQLQRLEKRFGEYREYIEAAGSKYTSEVVPGGVKIELSGVTKDFSPSVMIFGRHKTIHAKPFSFGRMPYRAMLSLKYAVIVVPEL